MSSEEVLRKYLEPCRDVQPPPRITVQDFIAKSDAFPIAFPVDTARVKTLLQNGHSEADLEDKINSAYPLIHERLLPLLAMFIHKKKQYGKKKEKELYSSMNLLELVNRLLQKRPLVFLNSNDIHILRNGKGGVGNFDRIGQSNEDPKIPITEYISYDEMKLSALVSVSSKSVFINNGERNNRGVPGSKESFQADGIIVGMVGARLHRIGAMERQDCLVEETQNTKENGYGENPPDKQWLIKEWGRLWDPENPLPTWENAIGDHYITIGPNEIFNTKIYKARIFITAEMLLTEASHRAKVAGLEAYVHVVGLGLGVWQRCAAQTQLFVESWGDALTAADTNNIGHVDFSWIPTETCHGVGDGEKFPNTNVTLHFSKRALHDQVPNGMLLVDSFAWDGNSFPGNEYWSGSLDSSGDPAAACSSQIAELHNSRINPLVSAENLHIVSRNGVEHISCYAGRILDIM